MWGVRGSRVKSVFLRRHSVVWDVRSQYGQGCPSKWDRLWWVIRIWARWGRHSCRTGQHDLLELKYAKQSFYARKWVATESEPQQVEEGDRMERLHSLRCLCPRKVRKASIWRRHRESQLRWGEEVSTGWYDGTGDEKLFISRGNDQIDILKIMGATILTVREIIYKYQNGKSYDKFCSVT